MSYESLNTLGDDEAIAALAALDAKRRREHPERYAPPPPLIPGERMTAQHAPAAFSGTRREPAQMPERPEGWTCNLCPAAIPVPGVCGACLAHLDAQERAETIRRAVAREIPHDFAWAHWRAPELVQRVAGGMETIRRARNAFARFPREHPVVVLVGYGGRGKTCLAAAWIREQLGNERPVRWVLARDLERAECPDGETLPRDKATTAPWLVLDNLGTELDGAPRDGGIIAQRRKPVCDLVEYRSQKGLPMVITTAIGAELPPSATWMDYRRAVASLYGDNVGRRIHERAIVVRVEARVEDRS